MLNYWSLILLVFCSTLWGQGNAPIPRGWDLTLEPVQYVELSSLDMSEVIAEDLVADQDKSMPWRFGIQRVISVDIHSDGQWTE